MKIETHIKILLNSFRHWTGKDLVPVDKDIEKCIQNLWKTPFVIVSHGVEKDPILNYGNEMALKLWEMSWDEFVKIPSRLTVEPVNQEARDRLLARVTLNGFIEDYSGVRITSTGKRFFIEKAIVWNLLDQNNNYCGQAATFSDWRYL